MNLQLARQQNPKPYQRGQQGWIPGVQIELSRSQKLQYSITRQSGQRRREALQRASRSAYHLGNAYDEDFQRNHQEV